jgi:hypothetical protein
MPAYKSSIFVNLNRWYHILFHKLCTNCKSVNTTTFITKTLFVFIQNCYTYQTMCVFIIRHICVKVPGEHLKFLYAWKRPLLTICVYYNSIIWILKHGWGSTLESFDPYQDPGMQRHPHSFSGTWPPPHMYFYGMLPSKPHMSALTRSSTGLDKTYTIDVQGSVKTVSTDHLKPAYVLHVHAASASLPAISWLTPDGA